MRAECFCPCFQSYLSSQIPINVTFAQRYSMNELQLTIDYSWVSLQVYNEIKALQIRGPYSEEGTRLFGYANSFQNRLCTPDTPHVLVKITCP